MAVIWSLTSQNNSGRPDKADLYYCIVGKKVWGLVLNKKPFDQLNSRHSGQVPT